jgi:putative lipoprotein
MKKTIIIGLVLAVLAACIAQAPEAESGLVNTKWTLISFGAPLAETPVLEGSTITLEFGGEGQAGGSGGCNSYSAQYETQADTLSVGQIASTRMSCEQDGIGQQEQNYFQALEASGKYKLDGEHLTIWYGDRNDVLNFVKQ